MAELVPIGRFAQLTHLTVKALRLYDAQGLLRPAVVDFRTGFRYYSLGQVVRAERIRLLRSLEMPLTEIRAVLDAPNPEQVRRQLTSHRHRLEERIVGDQRALTVLATLDNPDAETERDHTMQPASQLERQEHQRRPSACSFCGKPNEVVERMIAGPNGVFICSECVALCDELIVEERASAAQR